MREILFRGKTDKNDYWVYGSLNNTDPQFPEIMYCDSNWNIHSHSIKPETIGQYTGLTDKNGTKIFEGDVVYMCPRKAVVKFSSNYNIGANGYEYNYNICGFYAENEIMTDCMIDGTVEVIGNIYDNKELLEEI